MISSLHTVLILSFVSWVIRNLMDHCDFRDSSLLETHKVNCKAGEANLKREVSGLKDGRGEADRKRRAESNRTDTGTFSPDSKTESSQRLLTLTQSLQGG